MYKIDEDNGWNDWVQLTFVRSNDYDKDVLYESHMVALGAIAKQRSKKAIIGGIGAYLVDRGYIKYYLVCWSCQPYQATADEEITQDSETFWVREGEWLCKGYWLNNIPSARNW